MNFQEFRSKLFDLGCFNTNQVYAWHPDFDKNNIGRWVRKGFLVKLRNGYYTFPEYKTKPDFALFIANRIYRPSYISLHTALAFYGIIPEAVSQITSITSQKNATFSNDFGEYSYKSVRPNLLFGYDIKPMDKGFSLYLATAEKALLDLLYLYPFYNSPTEMLNLRLDPDYLQNDFDLGGFLDYLKQFRCKALEKRAQMMQKAYQL